MTLIVQSVFEELDAPTLHAWVPVEQQIRNPGIQAKGYDLHQVVEPQRPGDLSLVVVADEAEEGEVLACASGASRSLGCLLPNIHFIHSRRAVEDPMRHTYFDAIQDAFKSDPNLQEKVRNLIVAGGFFSGYEACDPGLTVEFARSLGFPDERILNRVPLLERLKVEVEPDSLVQFPDAIPEDMVLTREVFHSVSATRVRVADFRNPKHGDYHKGRLKLELEARSGGIQSALLEAGQVSNDHVEALFQRVEGEGENIILDRVFPGEVPWSMCFTSGKLGFRSAGFHAMAFSPVDGKHLKWSSAMSYGYQLPGIPAGHIEMALPYNRMMARGWYGRQGMGDIGINWRSIPGRDRPMLHKAGIKSDSEKPAMGVLAAVERQLERLGKLLAMHTRLYQDKVEGGVRPWTWTGLTARIEGDGHLYTRERGSGAIVPPTYLDVSRGCPTTLLILVGESGDQMLEQLEVIKPLIGALTPSEWEERYGATRK